MISRKNLESWNIFSNKIFVAKKNIAHCKTDQSNSYNICVQILHRKTCNLYEYYLQCVYKQTWVRRTINMNLNHGPKNLQGWKWLGRKRTNHSFLLTQMASQITRPPRAGLCSLSSWVTYHHTACGCRPAPPLHTRSAKECRGYHQTCIALHSLHYRCCMGWDLQDHIQIDCTSEQ